MERTNISFLFIIDDFEKEENRNKILYAITFYLKDSFNVILDFSIISNIISVDNKNVLDNISKLVSELYNILGMDGFKKRILLKGTTDILKVIIRDTLKDLLDMDYTTKWDYISYIYVVNRNELIPQNPPLKNNFGLPNEQ